MLASNEAFERTTDDANVRPIRVLESLFAISQKRLPYLDNPSSTRRPEDRPQHFGASVSAVRRVLLKEDVENPFGDRSTFSRDTKR